MAVVQVPTSPEVITTAQDLHGGFATATSGAEHVTWPPSAEAGEYGYGPAFGVPVAPFGSLTRELLRMTTVLDALRLVVDTAERVVAGADLVSVTLCGPGGTLSTPVATHEGAAELDEVQYRAGHGPCVDAARQDGPRHVGSDDLRVEGRWPGFAAAASRCGVGAIVSTGLLPAGRGRLPGALNLYSRRPHGLTTADRHLALLLVTHCSLALAYRHTAELADRRRADLKRAIDTRDLIGQAKGILMNRRGITADEAFDLLRRTSQDRNVKVVDLARTLVSRHAELDE